MKPSASSGAPALVLASTSPFRRELLGRLGIPFEVASPEYEEANCAGLSPREQALRHAVGKARAVAASVGDRVVIGSDQVADLGGAPLGKPGSREAAREQLARMAGRAVDFHTGLAVMRGDCEEATVETFRVVLRPLSPAQIRAYVDRELPLDCAGSFRIEGLGIALMERLEGPDYTALIGLPLVALVRMLGRFGIDVLQGG